MYKFDATGYGDKIKKVYLTHLDLRGIWLEDVADRAVAVGIWPRKSGWGLGWVDLVQHVTEGEYEPDEEGNPVVKRRYCLVKLVWHTGVLEKEEYRERLGLIKGLSEQDIEDAYEVGVDAGLHLAVTQKDIDRVIKRWKENDEPTNEPRKGC